MRLLPLVAATYFMVSGGPYGLEDIIGMAGYGRALLLLYGAAVLEPADCADGGGACLGDAGGGRVLSMGEAGDGAVLGVPGGVAVARG